MKYLFLIFMLGCSQVSVLHKNQASDQVEVSNKSSIFFLATLENATETEIETCQLVLTSPEHGSYSLNLKFGAETYLFNIPAGKYQLNKLSCNLMNNFSIETLLPIFVAQKGQYAYLGKLSFKIVKRSELIMGVDRRSSLAQADVLSSLPEEAQWNLYSPYTMKQIDKEMFELTPDKRRNIFLGISPQDKSLIEIPSIKLCNREEGQFNPLRLGTLEYEIVFSKEQLKKVQLKRSHSAYSDRYISCVEETLKQATSMLSKDVRVQVKL